MAPPIDTRLGPGTLKLGAPLVDFGAQISNVMLEPSTDEEDGTPTLGDPDPLPELAESWVLTGEAVQDFEEPTGFVNYCMDNALSVVAFEWVPNTPAGTKYAGNVLLTAVPIGGDVAAQVKSAFEFPVQGTPVRTDPPGAPAQSSREAIAARRARRSSLSPRPAVAEKASSSSSGSKAKPRSVQT
jgi:hypothetical protein